MTENKAKSLLDKSESKSDEADKKDGEDEKASVGLDGKEKKIDESNQNPSPNKSPNAVSKGPKKENEPLGKKASKNRISQEDVEKDDPRFETNKSRLSPSKPKQLSKTAMNESKLSIRSNRSINKNSDSDKVEPVKKKKSEVLPKPQLILPEENKEEKKKPVLKKLESKDKCSLKEKEKEKPTIKRKSKHNENKENDKSNERLKIKEEHHTKMKFKFQTPKDEVDLALLHIEESQSSQLKLMEEFRIAVQQIHMLLIQLMRKGNDNGELEIMKSDKRSSNPEKLYKTVNQANVFWSMNKDMQPMLYESMRFNCAQLGSTERYLQERGPKQMVKLKKFIYDHYPTYVALKKSLLKVITKAKPDQQAMKEEIIKKMTKFASKRFLHKKNEFLMEIECAFAELARHHQYSEKLWSNIHLLKIEKDYRPERIDKKQFDRFDKR